MVSAEGNESGSHLVLREHLKFNQVESEARNTRKRLSEGRSVRSLYVTEGTKDADAVVRRLSFDESLVMMAEGIHTYPSRTRPLSPPAPMVLGAQAPGRVGRRQAIYI
jgi:hypothetical protein